MHPSNNRLSYNRRHGNAICFALRGCIKKGDYRRQPPNPPSQTTTRPIRYGAEQPSQKQSGSAAGNVRDGLCDYRTAAPRTIVGAYYGSLRPFKITGMVTTEIKTHTNTRISAERGRFVLTPWKRAKSAASANMADCTFLPVDALALQQLKRRAQTAHSNFIAYNLVLTMSSNRPQVGYSSCDRPISLFFRADSGRDVGAEMYQRSWATSYSSSSWHASTP